MCPEGPAFGRSGHTGLSLNGPNARSCPANLKSQTVISSWGGARRAPPYAFTELGVAMLSSVLRTKRAIQMNIVIMRAFVRLRGIIAASKDLARRMAQIEALQRRHQSMIIAVVEEIERLKHSPVPPKRRIGFLSGRE